MSSNNEQPADGLKQTRVVLNYSEMTDDQAADCSLQGKTERQRRTITGDLSLSTAQQPQRTRGLRSAHLGTGINKLRKLRYSDI